jgi:NADPH-dependent 2,4-dienoyl-CoA reductase/sulfur reductase-like enzyme
LWIREFNGADLVIDRVARIDTSNKQDDTAAGDRYPYDDLVLSTGSRPVIPPIPGVEGKNISAVRSIQDLSLLRQLASTGKRAVVVGGGYIGIEVAVVLKQMGLDVTDAKGVYACGDCAEKTSFVTDQPTRGEFGTNAVFMAKTVAHNILGKKKTFPGVINANVTAVYDWSLGSAGLTEKMARDAGIDVVTGYSEVLNKYPMMNQVDTIRTKLVFNRENRKIVGGSVLRKGNCSAHNVDFISFAIQMGATIDDLMDYQYATHPELAAKPSDNTYVFATKNALTK